MRLADLSKPAWDAAIEAARVMTTCSPDRDVDRARFRAAKDELTALLPEGEDVREIISQAAHWHMLDQLAAVMAGTRKLEIVR